MISVDHTTYADGSARCTSAAEQKQLWSGAVQAAGSGVQPRLGSKPKDVWVFCPALAYKTVLAIGCHCLTDLQPFPVCQPGGAATALHTARHSWQYSCSPRWWLQVQWPPLANRVPCCVVVRVWMLVSCAFGGSYRPTCIHHWFMYTVWHIKLTHIQHFVSIGTLRRPWTIV